MSIEDLTVIEFIKSCYPDGLPPELVFYGGSFNPWHDGHNEALNKAASKHVIVIPDHNPLKPLNLIGRMKNEEAILRDLRANQRLFTGFLNRTSHNPTQGWISEIRRTFPSLQIGLLVGFDNFAILDRWHNSSLLIADLNRIYVLSRNDIPSVKKAQIEKLTAMNRNIEIVFLGHHAYESVSSTEIRMAIDINRNAVAGL